MDHILLAQEYKARAEGFKDIAGVDEVGRGPLAGPVVAAAVILREYDFSAKIDDSKRLSALQRQRAYEEISDKAYIGIGIVPEDIIDSINIYRATILAMETAVLDLSRRPDLILIDGNIRLKFSCRQLSIVGGDRKSLSIASASIIAKVTRDRLLRFYHEIFPVYGFDRHKGYGTKRHIAALRERGMSPVHRRSFNFKSIDTDTV